MCVVCKVSLDTTVKSSVWCDSIVTVRPHFLKVCHIFLKEF